LFSSDVPGESILAHNSIASIEILKNKETMEKAITNGRNKAQEINLKPEIKKG
jgi:hypothetical protein